MSIQALNWAMSLKTGRSNCKFVLISLANRADENHSCFPKVSTIVQETEICERSVRKWLNWLEENGLIEIKKQFLKGRQIHNRYVLKLDNLALQNMQGCGVQKMQGDGLQKMQGGPAKDAALGVQKMHTEPSLEPTKEPFRPDFSIEEVLKEFGEVYPDRGGQPINLAKAKEMLAELIANGEDSKPILEGVKRYRDEMKSEKPSKRKFIKSAPAFLEQRIWEDYSPEALPEVLIAEGLDGNTAAPWKDILHGWPDQAVAKAWLYPLKLRACTQCQVTLSAPNDWFRGHVTQEYSRALDAAFKRHLPDLEKFEVTVEGKN